MADRTDDDEPDSFAEIDGNPAPTDAAFIKGATVLLHYAQERYGIHKLHMETSPDQCTGDTERLRVLSYFCQLCTLDERSVIGVVLVGSDVEVIVKANNSACDPITKDIVTARSVQRKDSGFTTAATALFGCDRAHLAGVQQRLMRPNSGQLSAWMATYNSSRITCSTIVRRERQTSLLPEPTAFITP